MKNYSRIFNKMWFLALLLVVFMAGCEKDDPGAPSGTNPIVIPVQTTVQATVPLVGASNFAVLAGCSTVTNTINNDYWRPWTKSGFFVSGFPPGILNGTQHINNINNIISNQAKLDLTAAYNDAAGRTSTDIVTLSGNIGGLTLTPGLYKIASKNMCESCNSFIKGRLSRDRWNGNLENM